MENITIEALINAPIEKVWEYWNKPEHITKWAFASDDWEASEATNDLQVGGNFKTHMQAKDGSAGFDFTGTYTAIEEHTRIDYRMDDGRHVSTLFEEAEGGTRVTTTFDPESENPLEMQRQGWQAILNNFKKYTENN